jgi:hypothetical protein
MTLIIEVALGIVFGFLILSNLDAIVGLGMTAAFGAFWLALLAIVGVGLYLGWEWIASHERVLIGVIVMAFILAASIVADWIGNRTGLESSDILVFAAMLLVLVSATAVFSELIYKWSSDAAAPLLYLFLVPIVGLWAWILVKAKRHIRERKKPLNAVSVESGQN